MLPGSLGLVQEQLGDVLQQQDRLDSTPLLVSLEGWTAPGSKAKPWPPMHVRAGIAAKLRLCACVYVCTTKAVWACSTEMLCVCCMLTQR